MTCGKFLLFFGDDLIFIFILGGFGKKNTVIFIGRFIMNI